MKTLDHHIWPMTTARRELVNAKPADDYLLTFREVHGTRTQLVKRGATRKQAIAFAERHDVPIPNEAPALHESQGVCRDAHAAQHELQGSSHDEFADRARIDHHV